MTLQSNNYNLISDTGLISSVISRRINEKISRHLAPSRLGDTDPDALFFNDTRAPETGLLIYVRDDFRSFQRLKQAVNIWSSLPEESRLLILNVFLGKIRSVHEGESRKDIVLVFCRFFLTELIPILSLCDN